MCDTIDEIYDELINLLKKNNQLKILENNNNEISIIIPLDTIKIKEILFILKEISKKDEENIKDLIIVISEMKKEINQLKEKLNNSNEKNIELNNKINSLEQENKILKQENKIFKQKLDKIENIMPFIESLKIYFNSDIDSLIIGNNENYKMNLKNFIGIEKKIKLQLLFRMSRDGDNFQTFHNLCDNQGPTITLYQFEDNVLGLYTPLSWNTTSQWISDQRMFLFSLTYNKKSNKNNKNSRGIFCCPTHGPYTDFIVIYAGTTMKKPIIDPSTSGYDNCQYLYPNKNKGTYTCLEIEVFKII